VIFFNFELSLMKQI